MFVDLLNTLLGALSLGLILSLTFVFPESDGDFTEASRKLRTVLPIIFGLWLIAAIGNLLATLANLFETPIIEIFDATTIRSFVTQTSLGRLQLIQVLSALMLVLISRNLRRTGGSLFAYFIAFALSKYLFNPPQEVMSPIGLSRNLGKSLHGRFLALLGWFLLGYLTSLLLSYQDLPISYVEATRSIFIIILSGLFVRFILRFTHLPQSPMPNI